MKNRTEVIVVNGKVASRKSLLLPIVSISLPFILIAVIELALRLLNSGANLDVFIEYPQNPSYLVFNPEASRKYFADEDLAPVGNLEPFKKHKDPNTIRIFVLGESTTIGYPYFHNASFHRMIQYRLMSTYPEKRVEIINLALTGVNSYTVLGFAKELYPYEPDAVAIYVGHNEYYGALGVASTESFGDAPWLINSVLKLRELRLFQLMSSLYVRLTRAGKGDAGTRMKQMVAHDEIALGSALYYRGVVQFERNLDNTIGELQSHGVPVFVSNLVSNERGMAPFISTGPDSVHVPEFNVNFRKAITALQASDSAAAYTFLLKANILFSAHARCNYLLGVLSEQTQDSVSAKMFYGRARDLDGLRFRAPSEFNAVLKSLCASYSNAHFVDTEAEFRSRTHWSVPGNDLFLEHVHPNVMGYAIMSDAFYTEMKHQHIFPLAQEAEMSLHELTASIPVSQLDSLVGRFRVNALKASWPFNEVLQEQPMQVKSDTERLAWHLFKKQISWDQAMDSMYRFHVSDGRLDKAEKIVEAMVLENPNDAAYWERAAVINANIGDKSKAVKYLRRAFDIAPTFEKARYLFVLYLQMDKPFDALPYIDYGIKHNTTTHNLQDLKHQVEKIISMEDTLRNNPMDIKAMIQIAQIYASMNSPEPARKYVSKAREIDGQNAELTLISEKLKSTSSRL
jgi:tetratricopeptide (TPR) repeat protein